MQMVAYLRTGMLSQSTLFWFIAAPFHGALNSRKLSYCQWPRLNMWQLHMLSKKPSGFIPSSPKFFTSPSTLPPFFWTTNLPLSSQRTINTTHAPSISTFNFILFIILLKMAQFNLSIALLTRWTYQGHSIHENEAFCFPIQTLAAFKGSLGLARCLKLWTETKTGP